MARCDENISVIGLGCDVDVVVYLRCRWGARLRAEISLEEGFRASPPRRTIWRRLIPIHVSVVPTKAMTDLLARGHAVIEQDTVVIWAMKHLRLWQPD